MLTITQTSDDKKAIPWLITNRNGWHAGDKAHFTNPAVDLFH